jgi:hypothetical protein
MRLRVDGKYECANCGEVLKVPRGVEPTVVFRGGSGKPSVRALLVNGREIHQCEFGHRVDPAK